MSRGALIISTIALIVAVYSAGNQGLTRPPVAAPVLSREWGQGVVAVLREYDRRLTALERKP